MKTQLVVNKGSGYMGGTTGCTCGRCSRGGTTKTYEEVVASLKERTQGREVVGLVMTPRKPDGSGGEVKKIISYDPAPKREYAVPRNYSYAREQTAHNTKSGVTMTTDRQYAVPRKYWEPARNFDLEAPAPAEVPTNQAEAEALERLRAELIAAQPSLDRGDGVKAEDRVMAIEDLLRRWRKLQQIARA